MIVAEGILKWISDKNAKYIYLVPGSQIDPLTKAVVACRDLNAIVACSELGAGFMADGYSRVSETVGVFIGIGGAGFLYVLPSMVISRVDRSSVLYITGEAPNYLQDEFVFQGTGLEGSRDSSIAKSAIDDSYKITDKNIWSHLAEIEPILEKRKPVHLSIAFNEQNSEIKECNVKLPHKVRLPVEDLEWLESVVSRIERAKTPVVLIGQQAEIYCKKELLSLFKNTNLIFATTLETKGMLLETGTNSLGCFGYACSDLAMDSFLEQGSDVILALGITFNQRELFNWDERLSRNKELIVITNRKSRPKILVGKTDLFFTNHLDLVCDHLSNNLSRRETNLKGKLLRTEVEKVFSTEWLVQEMRRMTSAETKLFVDAGYHRAIAARYWQIQSLNSFFSSERQTPMGWAIPAAIGGQLADNEGYTVVLTGDGCMRMQGQEISTARRYKLPIIFIVINNSSYGSVSARLDDNERDQLSLLPETDWVKFAESMGVEGAFSNSCESFVNALTLAIESKNTFLIEAKIPLELSKPCSSYVPVSTWPENV